MIVVLADDLSGATELAGLGWARGLTAEVQTRFDPLSSAEVIALDTDTRCRSAAEAAKILEKTGRLVLGASPSWIYKKTDSVLRGHVRVELTALLNALGKRRALLISANPSRGRIIQGGRYFVGGAPLNRTVFATDPEYPAGTAQVAELLSREPGADVRLLGASQALPQEGIAIPDVNSIAELARYAALLDEGTLAAGAAEFFDAVLAHRAQATARFPERAPSTSPNPLSLLVCGSAAAWPVSRQRCENRSMPVLQVPARMFLNIRDSAQRAPELLNWATAAAQELKAAGKGMIAIGDLQLPAGYQPAQLLQPLAQAVSALLRLVPVKRILMEGGATAAAVLRELDWKRLTVEENVAPGLPLLRVTGSGRSPFLVIKPGSYPWPECVWQ